MIINLIKHYILTALKPLERRGVYLTMRNKILPANVTRDITECRQRSFCPFAHFDCVWRALVYITCNDIEGDIVLCGVATGGMAKFMLKYMHGSDRKLWLYDTYDGGTLPDAANDGSFEVKHGSEIKQIMSTSELEVKRYLQFDNRIVWVTGDILKTLPESRPTSGKIALLYLDTDYYKTTLHELVHLEPFVSQGGVIVADDMGLCVGERQAVNEYYARKPYKPLMIPMDEAGSLWIKQ